MSKSMDGGGATTSIPTLSEGGVKYDNKTDKAELFATEFKQNSDKSNHSHSFISLSNFMETTWTKQSAEVAEAQHKLDTNLEFHELISAIGSGKRGSAPGEDQVTYEMLQHMPSEALKMLLQLYNKSWADGRLYDP